MVSAPTRLAPFMERTAFHEGSAASSRRPATMRIVRLTVGLLLLMLGHAGLSRAQAGAPDAPSTLTGKSLRVEPTAVDFGDVGRGALVTHDVKVTNTGHGHHDDVRITGIDRPATADCAQFQLQAPAAFPLSLIHI